ncbi:MAG: HIT family protein [Vicingaceae bacterium]|nr:MAG: HIT family protein [Vicingaceae bacterium]GIV42506.1 MAG: HIT family protein [Vicingaceae bacterium]
MASIFTKIIKGELPCHKIAENEHCIAFLDIFPLKKGHTLVVPKKEIDLIFDLPDKEYSELWMFAKDIAKKIKKAVPCQRVGIAVVGMEVPHAHIHLIPLDNIDDINFSRPKLKLTPEELEEIAQKIKNA